MKDKVIQRKMKFLYSLLLVFINIINICAQQITRQTLGSVGFTNVESTMILRQTIGQPSNTEVVTSLSPRIGLRQGFQQPFAIRQLCSSCIHCKNNIYPNPSSGQIFFETGEDAGSYSVKIFDIQGNEVFSRRNVYSGKLDLDLSFLSSGLFLLKYSTKEGYNCYNKLFITK